MQTTTQHTSTAADIFDVADFNERVVGAYNAGNADRCLPADEAMARSLISPATSVLRDFSYIAPDLPSFNNANCVACLDCVTQCPDTAILGKVIDRGVADKALSALQPAELDETRKCLSTTAKYWSNFEKKGQTPGYFGIFVDPTKCKGCGECVEVCGDRNALTMIHKTADNLESSRRTFAFYRKMPETPKGFILEKSLQDMMLAERGLLFTGGAGSCMGCGEASVIRMMLAATGFVHGPDGVGIAAATGCNTVYSSTFPYNPFRVPWTNSLFENVAAVAVGIRLMWDQYGWKDKRVWTIGGDGAMIDIGFQALSRLLASGKDIKVLVLDTQVYSNTGGQASTSTYTAQETKLSLHGKVIPGKVERRKELANICLMHPDTFVAQTTAAHPNHFYKAILAANEYDGPAVINVYTTCQPEHGVADDMSAHQAKLAVSSRAFPLVIHDPRAGRKMSERLNLQGNPAVKEDWYKHPKTGELIDFIHFARTEGRFARHFDKEGKPSQTLLNAQQDRLDNWRTLQELAGII